MCARPSLRLELAQSFSLLLDLALLNMAGPSRHGGHEGVRPGDADDQMQHSASQDSVTNNQVLLPFLRRDLRLELVDPDVLPLRPRDPVLARPLDGTTGFTASVGDQPPTPLLNRLPQLFPVSQQPGNLPSNGGHINSNPTRSTRNPLRARLAALGRTAYARGQGGGRERRNDRGKISFSQCDVLFT